MPRIYRVIPEMMWTLDPNVEAARRRPGWVEFHRACGRAVLYFDHMVRQGRSGPYKCTAYSLDGRQPVHVADGFGPTVIDAVADAYRRSGRPVAEAELARLLGAPLAEPATNLFDDILGGEPFDIEDILG